MGEGGTKARPSRRAERGRVLGEGVPLPPAWESGERRRTLDFAPFFIDYEASSGVIFSHFSVKMGGGAFYIDSLPMSKTGRQLPPCPTPGSAALYI